MSTKRSKSGYHLKKIKKGTLGKISKVQEEVEEYQDTKQQKCKIMQELELANIYGTLEAVALPRASKILKSLKSLK